MSITFNKAQLTKAAEAALASHERTRVNYAKAVDEYKTSALAAHDERYRPTIVRLRNELTKALAKAGPIRREKLQTAIGGSTIDSLFYGSGPSDREIRNNVDRPETLLSPLEVAETRTLLAVLQAATGDTITTNELRLLGLKNLQTVFSAAVATA